MKHIGNIFSNEGVKKFMEKKPKTQNKNSEFAFNLMLRKVMSSILKEEYKSNEPCTYPGVDFLKIRFNMSFSYVGKMVLYLVQNGYIAFFSGFKVDKDKIKQFLYPEDEPTSIKVSIQKEHSRYQSVKEISRQ